MDLQRLQQLAQETDNLLRREGYKETCPIDIIQEVQENLTNIVDYLKNRKDFQLIYRILDQDKRIVDNILQKRLSE